MAAVQEPVQIANHFGIGIGVRRLALSNPIRAGAARPLYPRRSMNLGLHQASSKK